MIIEVNSQSAAGLLTLLQLRGVGALTAIRLASRFAHLAEMVEASSESFRGLAKKPVIDALRNAGALHAAHGEALRQMEAAASQGVRLISYFADDYPRMLRRISDPPALLYVKGPLEPDEPCVACVGTREPTEFGRSAARRICAMLAERGYSIVSGLALGIDGECHQAALDHGGRTIAVLGNGLDSIQPVKHRGLAQRLLERGGALVSEQPLTAKALGRNLIRSVRIQSGLSLGTFVMQTDIDGGTMHTVRSTLEQGRLLFVPEPTGDSQFEDANRGIIALAEQFGPQLAGTLQAPAGFREILERQFRDRPTAWRIRGGIDDAALLENLRAAALQPNPTTL